MTKGNGSLTIADTLKALREDIQTENTLIAARLTWYITAQAFLFAAYVASWTSALGLPEAVRKYVPILGIALSVIVWVAVGAAVWAQHIYIVEQSRFIKKVRELVPLAPAELLALLAHERTTVPARRTSKGKKIGVWLHLVGRLPALLIPVLMSSAWLYALARRG